jgi:hypothetical protein
VLLAGIAVARERLAGRDPVAAIAHLRLGSADIAALDFDGATEIALLHGWNVFSDIGDEGHAIRTTLRALVTSGTPQWATVADRGRAHAVRSLDADSLQCLRLGSLLEVSEHSVAWWTDIGGWARKDRDARRRRAGLVAEQRSLALELSALEGTGLTPNWAGFEDSTLGYDIKTWRKTDIEAEECQSPDGTSWRSHYLEVKSALSGAEVFLTRGEWNFAAAHLTNWSLEIWTSVAGTPRSLDASVIGPHIPTDNGRGAWEQVRIPTAVLRYQPAGLVRPVESTSR